MTLADNRISLSCGWIQIDWVTWVAEKCHNPHSSLRTKRGLSYYFEFNVGSSISIIGQNGWRPFPSSDAEFHSTATNDDIQSYQVGVGEMWNEVPCHNIDNMPFDFHFITRWHPQHTFSYTYRLRVQYSMKYINKYWDTYNILAKTHLSVWAACFKIHFYIQIKTSYFGPYGI